MSAFWEVWAAWLTERLGGLALELLSGILLASVVQFLVDGLGGQAAVCAVASALYEGLLDPNGWSWVDVGQRAIGILLGLGAWALLR